VKCLASITDELISTLKKEEEICNEFLPLCREKTKYIISNNIEEIEKHTKLEQDMFDKILACERERRKALRNVATVMNKDYSQLKLSDVIDMLDGQPTEKKELSLIHDRLKSKMKEITQINEHNTSLIKQSLYMIEFNMNFIQSTWMSVGNNGYDNLAKHNDGCGDEPISRMFDARQ
jgi:flagellar biosynthesis/type III secretory pathway chaperone